MTAGEVSQALATLQARQSQYSGVSSLGLGQALGSLGPQQLANVASSPYSTIATSTGGGTHWHYRYEPTSNYYFSADGGDGARVTADETPSGPKAWLRGRVNEVLWEAK